LNLVQWLKDNIVAPRYMGNVIGLHPVMIFITIMIGARIDGVSGIVCALPAACVINVLLSHMVPRFAAEHPMELPADAEPKEVAEAKDIVKVDSPATTTD
jgi:predicted PurR-regulated permease PerM